MSKREVSLVQSLKKDGLPKFSVMVPSPNILLIDNIHSLAIEIKQDIGGSDDIKSIIENAVYSSSSTGLMAFSALFEKMWT